MTDEKFAVITGALAAPEISREGAQGSPPSGARRLTQQAPGGNDQRNFAIITELQL